MAFPSAPAWALVAGAATWGVIWYPYRVLAQAGIDGVWSSLVTYAIAFLLGVARFPRHARGLVRLPPLAWLMALALCGAMTMLWHPAHGFPWPASHAEWLGLGAGFLFALGNVLVRRLEQLSDATKSMVIWAGVVLVAAVAAYALAAETLRTQDLIGGGLIVLATIASGLAPPNQLNAIARSRER